MVGGYRVDCRGNEERKGRYAEGAEKDAEAQRQHTGRSGPRVGVMDWASSQAQAGAAPKGRATRNTKSTANRRGLWLDRQRRNPPTPGRARR
jgi:hypothetical protein